MGVCLIEDVLDSTHVQKIAPRAELGVVNTEGFGQAGEAFACVVEVNNVDSSGKVG